MLRARSELAPSRIALIGPQHVFMKCYELLEHTADLGVRVRGGSLEELFVNSAAAMYELIANPAAIRPSISVKTEVEADGRDSLLKAWLSELLYYFHAKEMLFKEFVIEEINDKRITSITRGEKIDASRHNLKHEIKAVTFHNLSIREESAKFTTDIIFDI